MPILLYLLVFLLPLGTRHLLGGVTPGFHEYEAFFFYGTDFFVIIFSIWSVLTKPSWLRVVASRGVGALLGAFLLATLASLFTAPSFALGAYVFARLVVLALFAVYLARFAESKKIVQTIFAIIAVAAVVQSVIGFSQVAKQGSIGLSMFGEPMLTSYSGAASTIKAESGRFLRAYGTFPHPNVLGAFLVIGLLTLAYWYTETERKLANAVFPEQWRKVDSMKKAWAKRGEWTRAQFVSAGRKYFSHKLFVQRMLIAAATFVVVLGLALTFSRAAWAAAVIGLAIFLVWALHQSFGAGVRLLGLLLVAGAATYLVLAPVILPRAEVSVTEPAVTDRLAYTEIGIQLLGSHPYGVGAGNQVLSAVRGGLYVDHGMTKVWDWEPVHNLYLLVATELGWLGLLSFLAFLGIVCWQLIRSGPHLETGLITAILLGLLIAGMFDHYLWDLQPGRLLFWFVVGLALSRILPREKVQS